MSCRFCQAFMDQTRILKTHEWTFKRRWWRISWTWDNFKTTLHFLLNFCLAVQNINSACVNKSSRTLFFITNSFAKHHEAIMLYFNKCGGFFFLCPRVTETLILSVVPLEPADPPREASEEAAPRRPSPQRTGRLICRITISWRAGERRRFQSHHWFVIPGGFGCVIGLMWLHRRNLQVLELLSFRETLIRWEKKIK